MSPSEKLSSVKLNQLQLLTVYLLILIEWISGWINQSMNLAIRCEPLRPLLNGTILGNDMLFGAIVRYQCNVGFRLQGPQTRTCQADGTWSDNQPTCAGELTGAVHGSNNQLIADISFNFNRLIYIAHSCAIARLVCFIFFRLSLKYFLNRKTSWSGKKIAIQHRDWGTYYYIF